VQDRSEQEQLTNKRCITATVAEALIAFTNEEVRYWADENGNPTLSTFDKLFEAKLLEEYARKRDLNRQQRTPLAPQRWSGDMRRSVFYAGECAEVKHKNKGDKARMHRIFWDHYMHGGNRRKMGIDEGACNLCKRPDSARHWIEECPHEEAVASRKRTHDEVERHIATLEVADVGLKQFVRTLAAYATLHEDSYMHKMGMYSHGLLKEIGEHLGICEIDEETRTAYHAAAVELGTLYLDGVIADYAFKRSNGKKLALQQLEELRRKRQTRRSAASKKANEKKSRRKNKPKVSKHLRMTDYLLLQSNAYGTGPGTGGAEDHRRMDAGIG